MSVTPAIGQTVWVSNARGETVPNVHFNVYQVNDPTRLPPVQVIPQAQRANETVAEYAERLSPYEFKSREDIERFMVMNPQGFREALEQDEKFRANVKELMQSWDTVAITGLAWCMQSKGHKDALDGSPLLLETVAHDFYEWAHQETRSIAANPYHRLASFEAHHEKRQQEREQIITQNEREQAERAAKQQAEREHSAQQQVERQNRQILTAVLAWENFVTRASELNAKLTIHDPAAAAFLSSGLPDALKTGHQAQMAAMGVLSFEHPDNVLYNVSQLAAQKPAFAKELSLFGLTQNDLTDPSRLNEVYKAVGLIVAEGRGGMGEQDLMRFLSPQTAQTLNEARNVIANPNLEKTGKVVEVREQLAVLMASHTGKLWALQPQQYQSLSLPESANLPLPQGVGHQQPVRADFDMG